MLSEHVQDAVDATVAPLFGSRTMIEPIPRFRLPDVEMEPQAAYQLIHDELSLDGNPLLNMASFVTTWMEPEVTKLMTETLPKNFIDADEYPQTAEIERRCVSIIADLFHAPSSGEQAMGTSTVGSSEAIHLCGLALKVNWRNRRAAAGQPTDRPNIVMGANVQVVWEKFVRYFDVEPRYVDMAPGRTVIGVDEAIALVDENTIAVVGILGSTYTGEFEPIAELDTALQELNARTGWQVPIHVDAASGGFVAPFAYPDLAWDFRLPSVRSINTSGHKFGLVYPGVGWAVWRDQADLPEELLFHDNYLGNDQITFDLNFSKGSSQVIGQYYNLIRLGRDGYRRIMDGLLDISRDLSAKARASEHFEVVSSDQALPLVTVRLKGERAYSCHDISEHLRLRGWIVPAYTLPPKVDDVSVLRVVIREGFSRDMADNLLADLDATIEHLEANPPAAPTVKPHHRQRHRVC
ncbi:glutamate decarboxylase [Rhabdothermincola salaria]|uniref:glutamate decarboxylase n=1 Tax=Rhabdothermincola salaria TaxID=2903142 RepID=UPI001E3EF435|nr:glutamate decarboxylase [Rhabdothermincola salaria]MCD9623253.1 glutamate decarboxylase [Rhabdothermincola salaria]